MVALPAGAAARRGCCAFRGFSVSANRCRSATWLLLPFSLAAATVEESKLPPPAPPPIDFARDIKPLLERCLRCHGRENPRSHFRLTDRAAALKGGDQGLAILPGQSAQSPLIHFVAGLVKDMEMPPPGKGAPLTTNEISLLRAWIDQGVPWDEKEPREPSAPTISAAPQASWSTVRGNAATFRELEWQPRGGNGGTDQFQFQQRLPDGRRWAIEGRAFRDDYRLTLELRQPDLGFTRLGFEQFRKYYDSVGGYFAPFSPAAHDPGRDLHLDLGRAWIEIGLTRPHGPRLVLGYEYRFQEGDKSMLTWGPVSAPSGNLQDTRNIYPSAKHVDERAHILRLDLSHDLGGYHLEDNLRAEFHRVNTRRTDALFVSPGQSRPDAGVQVGEGHDHVQVANTVRVERELADWWFLSGGHLYSWLNGNASFRLAPQDETGRPGAGSAWFGNDILLHDVAQVFNLNSQFRPAKHLTASVGVQTEWQWQDAFGDVNYLEVTDPNDPTQNIPAPAVLRSQLDRWSLAEHGQVRYTGIPFTVLFAEGRWKQDRFTRFSEQQGGAHDFQLGTRTSLDWQEYRGGFTVSPWRRGSFIGQYRRRDHRADLDHPLDEHPRGFPGVGYPGFIRARHIATDELEARLTLHPAACLKTTLRYQWLTTAYRTLTDATPPDVVFDDATPGGRINAGHYEAHALSAGSTVTLFRRLYLSTTASYWKTRLATADHGSPAVAPLRGDVFSALASLSIVLDNKTDLMASWLYSRSDYGQDNAADGLPLGMVHTRHGVRAGIARKFGKHTVGRLQYGWFTYREPSSGTFRDYTAHQVMVALQVAWP